VKATAKALLRKLALFGFTGFVVACFGSFLGMLLTTAGFVVGGSIAEKFVAFGLLGHAWGRSKPPEFWWGGAMLGAAAGLLQGMVRNGFHPLFYAVMHGKEGNLSRAAIGLTWLALFRLGLRSAQYKRWLGGAAVLLGWRLGAFPAEPAVALIRARGDALELVADPVGLGIRAACGGLLLAAALVLLCEERAAPEA
jgi:hypothetical protein